MIYLIAFVAGLLMNAMPCVLPVLGLKLIALKGQKIPYIAGVFACFAILATVSLVVGSGIGAQMTSPWFRLALGLVCVAMGTQLFHWWQMPSFGSKMHGPFLTGCLTVVLGTSCSGPFLAPVLVFCAANHPVEVYAVFMSMSAGFVAPFAAPIPLPKPGPWMRKFEIGCGIVLFLAGIWLFSTFSVSQEEIVLDSRNNKAIVFTADWCLNCKIVKPIWDDQEVIEAMEGMELVVLDWTNGDESITRLLNEFNHRSIPFAIINVDGRETTLSGIYTTAQVLEAIHEQRKNSRAERND